MALDEREIEKIANLARLDITADEEKKYAEELSAVLEYVDILNEVNTEDVEETCQVTGLKNVYRSDTVKECDKQVKGSLLESFPEKKGNLLKVKAVFNNNGDES